MTYCRTDAGRHVPFLPNAFRICLVLVVLAFSGCLSIRQPAVKPRRENWVELPYRDGVQPCKSPPFFVTGVPIIEASINGVKGPFIIDSGAASPALTETGLRRSGIPQSCISDKTARTADGLLKVRMVSNVIVTLAPGVTVHWPMAVVLPTKPPHFGIIDYQTLKNARAVMDLKKKTITLHQ